MIDELLMTVTLYADDVYVRLDILVIRSLDITLCIYVYINVYAYPAPPKRLHVFFLPPLLHRKKNGGRVAARMFYDAEVSGSGTVADADGILLVVAARVLRVQRFWPPLSGGGEPALWAWSTTDPAAHCYLLQY